MRNLVLLLLILALPAGSAVAVETWTDVALVDTQCAPRVKDDPDAHTTKCALQCSKSGFGILTADGDFLTFDEVGNQKAVSALKATSKTDHLRATVTGDRQGGTIKVTSLSLEGPGR